MTISPAKSTKKHDLPRGSLPSDSTHGEDPTWQMILRRLPGIVWTTDRKLRISSVGGTTTDELLIQAESLVGKKIEAWFETGDASLPAIVAHRDALQGQSTTLEHIWRRKAYRLFVQPMLSKSGNIEGCVGLAIDITPRKLPLVVFEHEADNGSTASSPLLRQVVGRLRTEVEERRATQHALRDAQARFLQFASSIESTFWIYDVPQNRSCISVRDINACGPMRRTRQWLSRAMQLRATCTKKIASGSLRQKKVSLLERQPAPNFAFAGKMGLGAGFARERFPF